MNIENIDEVLRQIIQDDDIVNDVVMSLSSISGNKLNESIEAVFRSNRTGKLITSFDEFVKNENIIQNVPENLLLEAIVHLYARPALLITNGTFERPICSILADRLNLHILNIELAIKSIGRIELANHENYNWVGTGWLVGEDIIATNRHVAEAFSFSYTKDRVVFKTNISTMSIYKPSIDFKKEFNSNQSNEFEITKVLYLAEPNEPDLALLKVKKSNFQSSVLPSPLELELDIKGKINQDIAVIGYPAFDSRNTSTADMNRIFTSIYDVKRLQPGKLTNIKDEKCFTHDCSTLGGNSGSPVIDITSGKVLGIHFAGQYLKTNYAVPSNHIDEIIKKL